MKLYYDTGADALLRMTVGSEKLLVMAPDYFYNHDFSWRDNIYGSASIYGWADNTVATHKQRSADVFNAALTQLGGANPSHNTSIAYPLARVELVHVHGSHTGFEHTWRARFQEASIAYPSLGSSKRAESVRIYMANASLWNVAWGAIFATGVVDLNTTTEGIGEFDSGVNLYLEFNVGASSVTYYFTPAMLAAANADFGTTTVTDQFLKNNKGWIGFNHTYFQDLRNMINANKTATIYCNMYWGWTALEYYPTCYACDITNSSQNSGIATKRYTAQQPYLLMGVSDV